MYNYGYLNYEDPYLMQRPFDVRRLNRRVDELEVTVRRNRRQIRNLENRVARLEQRLGIREEEEA
jgi:predicted RNase H-like nuclease (RuvC/YqgF family)